MSRVPRRILRRLPAQISVPALRATGWPRSNMIDIRHLDVPEPFRLLAYWLTVGGEQGPSASLFLDEDEILRLDCLPDTPHLHYAIAEARHRGPAEPRVYLPPGDIDAHIDRAVFELGHNVGYCTGLHRQRSWRNVTVDEEAFGRSAAELGVVLRELLALHG